MPTPQELISDPEFLKLGVGERLRLVDELVTRISPDATNDAEREAMVKASNNLKLQVAQTAYQNNATESVKQESTLALLDSMDVPRGGSFDQDGVQFDFETIPDLKRDLVKFKFPKGEAIEDFTETGVPQGEDLLDFIANKHIDKFDENMLAVDMGKRLVQGARMGRLDIAEGAVNMIANIADQFPGKEMATEKATKRIINMFSVDFDGNIVPREEVDSRYRKLKDEGNLDFDNKNSPVRNRMDLFNPTTDGRSRIKIFDEFSDAVEKDMAEDVKSFRLKGFDTQRKEVQESLTFKPLAGDQLERRVSGFTEFSQDVASGIGSSLPAIALGPYGTIPAAVLQVGNAQYREVLEIRREAGDDFLEADRQAREAAITTGFTSGLIEGVADKFLGGLFFKNLGKATATSALHNITKGAVLGGLTELPTEAAQSALEAIIANEYREHEDKLTAAGITKEAIYNGFVGMFSGGAIGGTASTAAEFSKSMQGIKKLEQQLFNPEGDTAPLQEIIPGQSQEAQQNAQQQLPEDGGEQPAPTETPVQKPEPQTPSQEEGEAVQTQPDDQQVDPSTPEGESEGGIDNFVDRSEEGTREGQAVQEAQTQEDTIDLNESFRQAEILNQERDVSPSVSPSIEVDTSGPTTTVNDVPVVPPQQVKQASSKANNDGTSVPVAAPAPLPPPPENQVPGASATSQPGSSTLSIQDPVVRDEKRPVTKGGPGASSAKAEWRERNFTKRLAADETINQEIRNELPDNFYRVVANQETVNEVIGVIDERGLVGVSESIITGAIFTQTINGDRMQPRQLVTLSELVVRKLNKASKQAREAGNMEEVTQLDSLAQDVATEVGEYGTVLGQGVQAFAIWSRLTPEGMVRALEKNMTPTTRENTQTLVNEAAAQSSKKQREEAETKKKETLAWWEKIGEKAPRKDLGSGLTPQQIVQRMINGDPSLSEEYLAAEMRKVVDDKGERVYTEEIIEEATARTRIARNAELMAREASALQRRDAEAAKQAEREAVARRNRLRREAKALDNMLESINRPANTKPRIKKAAKEVIDRFISGEPMTEEVFRAELERTGFPFGRLDEAWTRAKLEKDLKTQERADEARVEFEKTLLKRDATDFAKRSKKVMGKHIFENLFGSEKSLINEIIKQGSVQAGVDQFDAFGIFSKAQRERLIELAEKAQEEPPGFKQDSAVRKMVAEAARMTGENKWVDILTSYWYANILSGFSTHAINIFGNGMHLAGRAGAAAIASGSPKSSWYMLKGMLKAAPRAAREFRSVVRTGIGRSKVELDFQKYDALETLWNDNPSGMKDRAKNLISMGKFVFRLLQAEDIFFYRVANEGRAHLMAHRAARMKTRKGDPRSMEEIVGELMGFNGQTWDDIVKDTREELGYRRDGKGMKFKENAEVSRRAQEVLEGRRDDTISESSRRWGEMVTYTNKPEGSMGHIAEALNRMISSVAIPTRFGDIEVLRPIIPFVNIVANVTSASLDFTPIGVARATRKSGKLLQKDTADNAKTNFERLEQGVAGVLGSMALAALYGLAEVFLDDDDPFFAVYGAGPSNPSLRAQMMSNGWKPFSIKIGDGYARYSETPLAMGGAIIGNMHDKKRFEGVTDESLTESAVKNAPLIAQAVMQTGFMSSVSDAFDMVSGNKDLSQFGSRTTSGMIPGSGMLRDIGKFTDPQIQDRDTASFWSSVMRDTPFIQRVGSKPMLNAFGEPIELDWLSQTPVVNRFFSARPDDPDWKFLARHNIAPPKPSFNEVTIQGLRRGQKRQLERVREERGRKLGRALSGVLTPDEAYELQLMAGPRTRKLVQYLRKKYPGEITPEEREDLKRQLENGTQEIRRDVKIEYFLRK